MSVSVLRAYAGKSDTARGDFAKADNDTMRETEQVPGTMTGFESDEAVQELQKRWRSQMRYLDGLLGGVSKGLREAAKNFKAEDVRRKEEMDKLLPPEYGPYVPGTEPSRYGLVHPGSAPLLNNPLIPGTQQPMYGPFVPGTAPTEPKS
ncbi:type VII secretion target [Streptomyces gossypii]|uniref:type VII secretion target n=1 Tax=Streptomyces gossypii TaxID=2883101 RepID=UPI0021A429B4|nr:type VII secretion target [Streptomyces gossypii]